MNRQKINTNKILNKKGYLDVSAETQLKIVFSMIKENKAITLSEIARTSKLPRQIVNYHLPLLIKKGLILPMEDKSYIVQPYFYKTDELFEYLEPLIIDLIRKSCLDFAEDKELAISEWLRALLAFWTVDIDVIAKKM